MAMEPGGRADKLGNEYERLWVVRQMLGVLMGDAVAVTWEPPGQDADGIDVLVEMPGGTRSLQSCKRENGGEGKWKLSHLHGRAVLQAAKRHLAADANNRFVFVSRDPCPELRDLAERAGNYDDQVDSYYDALSASLRQAFHQLGQYWGLSPETVASDRAVIFAQLQACSTAAYDLIPLMENINTLARHLVDGDSDTTRTLLADFAAQNLGQRLDRNLIVEHLAKKNLYINEIDDTHSVLQAIARQQQTFTDSISPYLINGHLISRPEAGTLIDAALSTQVDRPRLIMVHGKAGIGKSGVLFELVDQLRRQSVPFLPLRLDRNIPTGSAEQYGRTQCQLPMSPALALKAIAGKQRSVLILDQLDALRWTAAHTDQPMDVLTEVVREALNPLLRADITVILVCRTFDLEDDPRIAHLKSLAKSRDIEIGLLTADATREVVNAHQDVWASLSESQRLLLQQPQALYLWNDLRESTQAAPVFRTHTDLMRAFWRDLYDRKRPRDIAADAVQHVVRTLITHMDQSGRLTAPASMIEPSYARILDFLQSAGVLRIDERRQCIFTHQSYFDFLVADDLNRRVLAKEISLPDWLKSTDQSLFRREQLRQVFALQRDDDPPAYLKAIGDVLGDTGIRFHLKHLVIRLLAQAAPPTSSEADLVARMINEPGWRDQIYGQIVWNRPPWFVALDERGVWRRWLDSADDELVEMALRMMGFMTRHVGDRVVPILTGYLERDRAWRKRIARCLTWGDLDDEADEVFELRLHLAQRGLRSIGHVWWERLAKVRPVRAIRLFDLNIRLLIRSGEALRTGRSDRLRGTGIESHDRGEMKWLRRAAARQPLLVWKRIAPMCIRLERLRHWGVHHGDWTDFHSAKHKLADRSRDLLKTCETLLVAAGRSLARRRSDVFKRLLTHWDGKARTTLIERALLRSLSSLPDEEADSAIRWIIANPRRFRNGDPYDHASEQEPARRVLASLAPHCSSDVMAQLESAVLNYRDTHLKRMLRYDHERSMQGYYSPNHHGRAQYILLSALPADRLTDTTRGQLGVWQRKFGKASTGRGVRSYGGFVRSTIPHDRLHTLSDGDWMRLAAGDWTDRNGDGFRRKVMGKDQLGEASHRQFASDMGTMARRQPSRFAKLALMLPSEAPPNYVRAILRAFEQSEPPEILTKAKDQNKDHPERIPVLERELVSWRAVNQSEVEAIFEKIGWPQDSDTAKAICWLVQKRDDLVRSDKAIDLIAQIATEHPDPAPDEFASGHYDKEDRNKIIPDVANSSLNCVRGAAALAIENMLFANHGLYERLREPIESLTHDDNVAVRAAAIATCVPILNIDRDDAVTHFLAICSTDDDRVFESHYIDELLRYALWSHHEQLIAIIERMVRSEIKAVAKRGAAWATAAWMYCGWCEDLVAECASGSQAHRHGMAETAGQSPWEAATAAGRIKLLPPLFEDDDKDVRHDAARVFWREDPWSDERLAGLAMRFIKSRSFEEDPTPLIHGLVEIKGSLVHLADIVLGVADAFAGPLSQPAKDMSRGLVTDVPDVFKLLLRLYQQAQDNVQADLQIACLDRWDDLLRAGVGGFRDAESLLDSTER